MKPGTWLAAPALALFLALASHAAPAEWQPVTGELILKEQPGYGGLCGVAVDHANGDVFINLSDRGLYRSADQGKTWTHLGQEIIKGRTETPGCLQLDPTGKSPRILFPTVYGGAIAVGSKAGDPWKRMHAAATHIDWCAANWTGSEFKFLLALKHESGGVLLRSSDGGASFEEVGKGYGPAWIFNENTAVVTAARTPERPKAAILRTTDGGRTFQPVSDYAPVALPRWRGKTLYWLVEGALVQTTDQGATWTIVADIPIPQYGPVFGKTAKDLFVLTKTGVIASTDGGATWSKPLPLPDWKGASQLTWLDYDPIHDTLYAMKMTSDLYKLPHPNSG